VTAALSTCVSENLIVHGDGKLAFAPWSVPRPVADVYADSGNDGLLTKQITLPGKLLIDLKTDWTNDTPVEHMVLIRITRRYRTWITCNPNAVQFRDRWSWAIDNEPAEPVTSGIFNGQTGSAGDVGTNTVAEPNPGKFWHMWGTNSAEEWVGPLTTNQQLKVHYRQYVWTPPPFSDNANKNQPEHRANAGWARVQLISFPQQGTFVRG
jgi:hypothetical protein